MTYEELKEMSENEERLKRTLLDGALQDNYAPPHQREKEVADEIVSQMVDSYIQAKKSRLDDLYKILTPSQRIEIGKDKQNT